MLEIDKTCINGKKKRKPTDKGEMLYLEQEKSYSRFKFDETRCERTVSSVRDRSISIFYAKGRI